MKHKIPYDLVLTPVSISYKGITLEVEGSPDVEFVEDLPDAYPSVSVDVLQCRIFYLNDTGAIAISELGKMAQTQHEVNDGIEVIVPSKSYIIAPAEEDDGDGDPDTGLFVFIYAF